MKVRFFELLFFAAFAASACTADRVESGPKDTVQRSFIACCEQDTKTAYTEGKETLWQEGDVIRYYSRKNGDVGSATLTGEGSRVPITLSTGTGDSFIVAVYGGEGVSDNTGKGFTLVGAVNAVQSGRFYDAHVCIVKTYDLTPQSTLFFKNITSLIKLSFTRSDISYIVFSANGGERIHGGGKISCSFTGEDASAAFTEGGSSIRIDNGGAGTFFIATLPVLLSEGFTIDCYDAANYLLGRVTSGKSLEIGQNEIVNLGTLDSRIKDVHKDLSAPETANSYIVSEYGDYMFTATVKGPGPDTVDGTPWSAQVLWESNGDGSETSSGSVVKNVRLQDGYVLFSTGGQDGNALIIVKDRDDEPLWSWHIWVSKDFDPESSATQMPNGAGHLMDRNMGATSNASGNKESSGLYYKWGCKDPLPEGRQGSASTGGSAAWTSEKSISDPCPPGWRIPSGGPGGVWPTAVGAQSSVWDESEGGASICGSWYPAAGYCADGGIVGKWTSGYWWTCETYDGTPYSLSLEPDGSVLLSGLKLDGRYGASVRCQRMNDDPISAPGSVSISKKTVLIAPGETILLSASVLPSDSNVTTIDWLSSDGNVAGVDQEGLVSGVAPGKCTVTAMTYNGVSAECEVIVAPLDAAANSHIVRPGNLISFETVKGNGTASVGACSSVSILWETFGTSTRPNSGDVVKQARLIDGRIVVEAGADEGNALVAVEDSDGTILWSWHIWVDDEDLYALAQVYKNNAGTVMDRNLGATSATPGDVQALGLQYQWGRKDPFMGSAGSSNGRTAASTGSWKSVVSSSSTKPDYTVKNPTTFIKGRSTDYDWNYGDSYGLWANSKTIYDPCPPGWRVPGAGKRNIWFCAHDSQVWMVYPYTYNPQGINFGGDLGDYESIWWPGASYRDKQDGTPHVGDLYYWTCETASSYQYYCMNGSSHYMREIKEYGATACSIRCVAE